MECKTIQCNNNTNNIDYADNTIQINRIQYKTINHHTIQCNAMQYNSAYADPTIEQ